MWVAEWGWPGLWLLFQAWGRECFLNGTGEEDLPEQADRVGRSVLGRLRDGNAVGASVMHFGASMSEEIAGLSSRSVSAFIGRVISLSLSFPISVTGVLESVSLC